MGPFPNSNTTKRKSKLGFRENDVNTSPKSCDECGKSFHSWKALYGHLRIHRNRYRYRRVKEEVFPCSTTTNVMREHERDVATSLLSLADVKKKQEPAVDGDKGEGNDVLRVPSAGSGNPNGCDLERPVFDLNLLPPSDKADQGVDLELRLGC